MDIKRVLKMNRREQLALISTEDGRVVEEAFPVELGFMQNEATQECYAVPPSMIFYDEDAGKYVFVCDERDAAPIIISGEAKTAREAFEKNVNQIFEDTWPHDQYCVEREIRKGGWAKTLQYSFIAGVCVLILLVLAAGLKGGKWDSFFGGGNEPQVEVIHNGALQSH